MSNQDEIDASVGLIHRQTQLFKTPTLRLLIGNTNALFFSTQLSIQLLTQFSLKSDSKKPRLYRLKTSTSLTLFLLLPLLLSLLLSLKDNFNNYQILRHLDALTLSMVFYSSFHLTSSYCVLNAQPQKPLHCAVLFLSAQLKRKMNLIQSLNTL